MAAKNRNGKYSTGSPMTERVRIQGPNGWLTTPGVMGKRWSATKAVNHPGWTITHNKTGRAVGPHCLWEMERSDAIAIAAALDESGLDIDRQSPGRDVAYLIQAIAGEVIHEQT